MTSEYRIEKLPVPAVVNLAGGTALSGYFFQRTGAVSTEPDEDVHDILNTAERFFPFHVAEGQAGSAEVRLVNRRHVVLVRLVDPERESEISRSVGLTPRKFAVLRLSTGETVSGAFRVAMPSGKTRVSDYANSAETFCYLEGPDGVFLVNLDHVVDILTFSGAQGEAE